jgi:hypothetical protein
MFQIARMVAGRRLLIARHAAVNTTVARNTSLE